MTQPPPNSPTPAEEVPATHGLYLNGEWVAPDRTFTVVDPGSGKEVGKVGAVGREEAWQAVEDADAAFPGWRSLTGMERGDCLLALAGELDRRRETIARTITLENGKPLAQSKGEVGMTIDHFRWFAEEARRAYGRTVPHQKQGKRHLVLKQPVGVTAAIAPWNFPLVLSARKVAPALAAGCPVILRPASQTPLCAVALAQCAEAAGLPGGVFQLIAGPAQPIAQAFMEHPRCRKVTFTGSTQVGKKLIQSSAQTVTRLSLELGGHAPVLVFADADLDQAVEGAMITKFRNTGQSCIAANRVYVERSIYDRFLDAFVAKTKALKVGHGLEDGVEVGPVVNEEGLNTALAHIENALEAGGRVLCGGEAVDRGPGGGGHYLQPTVLADVPANARCMSEETFAPVAPVCAFDDEHEAVRQANDTPYGLAAYAFTNNLPRAWRLMEQLDAGTLGLNDAVPSTSNCPFGGMKESGLGRELGREGLEAFLETKHASIGGL